MPIEFRCVQCGKLLRTEDGTEGRQAQCPACGSLCAVPSREQPLPPPAETFEAFEPGQQRHPTAEPFPGESARLARQKVAGPAIALLVIAILGMGLQLLSIAGNLFMFAFPQPDLKFNGGLPIQVQVAVNSASAVLGLAFGVLILFGAVKMKNLEYYGLSIAASIVAMLPCVSPCCLLGLPFGIWALVVLSDPTVKASFKS